MTINNTSSNHYENLSVEGNSSNSSNTVTIAVPPFRPKQKRKQKQHRTIITIRQELEGIAKRHRRLLALDSTNKKDRKKLLEPRHADSEFHNNYHQHEHDEDDDDENYANEDQHYSTLFHEFARVVCHSKAIPRKELFEAWAMALYVHYYFPPSKHDDYHNYCDEDDDDDDDDDDDVDSRCQGKEENNDDNKNNNRKKIYYGRVADLACGHGLVSWALLLLDRSRKRTAICIDKSIPKSCDIIEQVMINRHSSVVYEHADNCDDVDGDGDGDVEQQEQTKTEIKTTTKKPQKQTKRWHYVEGDLCKNVKGDSSTLIVGVHCCGTLSDVILDLAISSNAPLALIPCCHTVKSLPLEQQTDEVIDSILKRNMEENKKNNNNNNSNKNDGQYVLLPTTKTDYIDKYRIQKLIEKGYSVQVEYIPSVITPKNRIIVATPRVPEDILRDMNYNEDNNNTDSSNSGSDGDGDGDDDKDSKGNATSYSSNSSKHQQQQQMILPKKKKSKAVFTIQLADTKSARSNIASQLSGRIAARMRKRRHPPNLNLSLILPHPEDALPPKRLNELSNKIATEIQLQTKNLQKKTVATNSKVDADVDDFIQHKITTHVEYGSNGPYTHSETGTCTYSRSFRIKYKINDPTGIQPEVTKRQAKELHKEVCRRIPIEFPGITLRQSIRS